MFFKKKLHLKPNHVGYIKEANEWNRLFDSHRFDSTGTLIMTEDEARWISLAACKDCEVKTMKVVNLVRDEFETQIVMSKDHGEALICSEPGSKQAQGVLGPDPTGNQREDFREYSDADPLRDEVRALYSRVMEQHIQTDECPRHKPSIW